MKRNPYPLAVASGILLALSFPPLPLGFLGFIALVPLLAGTRGKPVGIVFRSSMLGGFTFGICLLYWVANMWVEPSIRPFLIGGVGLLGVYMGFAFALPFLGLAFARLAFGTPGLLCLPFFFVGLEFLRSLSHLGFPWGSLAYTQTSYIKLIQFASFTSVAGVSLWVVSINLALYLLLFARVRRRVRFASLVFLILAFWLPITHWQMLHKFYGGSSVRVALIQAEVPPSLKRADEDEKRFTILFDQTYALAKEKCDLIVWPESSVPGYLRKESGYLHGVQKAVDSVDTPILLGANDLRQTGEGHYEYFNALFLVAPQKGIVDSYHKIHLVPFGERLPFDDVLPRLRSIPLGQGNFSPGKEFKPIKIGQVRFAPLICFECIFPRLVRRFVNNGAQFLVNVTDDGWWGRTSGQFQHAEMAVLRCIENRISMVRCANTGVSMFIDPYGRVKGRTRTFVRVTQSAPVSLREGETFYTRHGDLFGWAMVIMGFALIGWIVIRRRVAKSRPSAQITKEDREGLIESQPIYRGGGMDKKALAFFVIILLLAGCTLFAKRGSLKNCEFRFKGVEVTDFTLPEMTLSVTVTAKNTNDIDVVVDKLSYELFINGKKALKGLMGQGVTIPPGKTGTLNTTVTLDAIELGSTIAWAVKEKKANYDLRGTVHLGSSRGTFSFPVFVSK